MIKFNVFKRLKTEGISYEKSLKKNMCGWKSTGVGIGVWPSGVDKVGLRTFLSIQYIYIGLALIWIVL